MSRWCEAHTCRAKFHGSPGQWQIPPTLYHRFELLTGRYFKRHHSSPQVAAAIAEVADLLALGREPEPFPYEGRRWHAPGTLTGRPTSAEWYAHREIKRLLDPPPTADRRARDSNTGKAISGRASHGRSIPRRRQPPVEPIEILKAVLTVFYTSEADPPLFDDAGLTHALGSSVLDLRPHAVRWSAWEPGGFDPRTGLHRKKGQESATRKPGAKARRYIGEWIRDHLGLWLYGAIAQIREDDQARADRREAFRAAAMKKAAPAPAVAAPSAPTPAIVVPSPAPPAATPTGASAASPSWLQYLERRSLEGSLAQRPK